MFAKPKSELMSLAAEVQRCWELGDVAGFRAVMAPNAKMSIPRIGVNAQGFDAMWRVRESASRKDAAGGLAPLSLHIMGSVRVIKQAVNALVTVVSRETGETESLAESTFSFNNSGRCVDLSIDIVWVKDPQAAVPTAAPEQVTLAHVPTTLTYWDGRGNAEVIRMMLAVCGESWRDEVYLDEASAHVTGRAQMDAMQASGALAFDQLPLLRIDGINLVQKMACVRYLARKHNLYGSGPIEAAKCDILLDGSKADAIERVRAEQSRRRLPPTCIAHKQSALGSRRHSVRLERLQAA